MDSKLKQINTIIRQIFPISLIILLLLFLQTAQSETPVEIAKPIDKGDRILALATNEASDHNYDKAMQQAKKIGVMAVSLPIPWDEIEKRPGIFSMKPNFLAIANSYYPAANVKVALELNPIDTNNKRMPEDLVNKPYDHPEVIKRYKKALDYVFSQIPNLELVSFSIGNEIDGVLQSREDWAQYSNFFKETAMYARSKYDGLNVGSKGMFHGMTKNHQKAFNKLNRNSDIVMVTYYPLKSDFSVENPYVVHRDFNKITKLYSEKPIYFMEIGYPSGHKNSSSEKNQALFVRNTFEAWDQHADNIKLLEFTWLHDQPKSAIDSYEIYYGSSDTGFLSFLSTLGLRTYHGKDKKAFKELVKQANIRGWK